MLNYSKSISMLVLITTAALGATACPDETRFEGESRFFEPREFGDYEFDGQPELMGPNRLMFGEVEPGQTVERVAVIRNQGRLPLKFQDWQISPEFELSFPLFEDDPTEIAPGGRIEAVVRFRGQDDRQVRGTLSVETNDVRHERYTIELFANVILPCLEIEPAQSLDFGQVPRNTPSYRTLNFINCSPNGVTHFHVDALRGAPEFSIVDPGIAAGGEVALQPGESRSVRVAFNPATPGHYEAQLQILTDDEFDPLRGVDLLGIGEPYACPVAVIEASHPARGSVTADPTGSLEVVPLDYVQLDSRASHAPDGSPIQRVEWTLVERPADTNVRLSNPAHSLRNELWMELSGVYVVELHVWDERDMRSCEPARVELRSVSDKDIHIQLVWDTPNDPDRYNNHGTDLDLHLLHPLGNWNQRPYDCYWQNMNPDWGIPNNSLDDPSLDIDQLQGWGPENINLDYPEDNTTYSVGVHYFSANGYGASFATVRIYIGGILHTEVPRKRMSDKQFWHAVDIHWPQEHVTVIDTLHGTFPR